MQHITRGYTIMTYIMRYIIMRHIYIYIIFLYMIYIYIVYHYELLGCIMRYMEVSSPWGHP